ncbi:MAG: prepilin-type N-terminal cleavage/methylation domain-containing protein [Phycisphaerales bacterium]|nr:prepilin-type N-terminal cleavage/methylation domain-containing protein [Phycisphaerales bacterium]
MSRPLHKRGLRRTRNIEQGFTLIESAMATVIIGVGVLAMVDAQSSFITANSWSSHAASGTYLANEIREMTRNLPKHDPVVGLFIEDDGEGGVLHGWGPDAGEVSVDDFDDIEDFDGITFSFQGTAGFDDGDLPGPINAYGEIIPDISIDGAESGSTTNGVFTGTPMYGWSQVVSVQKVDPFDPSTVVADNFTEEAEGDFPGREVDEYPLRVTVSVFYQSATAINPELVTEVMWVVP